jgi:hypothetical protein
LATKFAYKKGWEEDTERCETGEPALQREIIKKSNVADPLNFSPDSDADPDPAIYDSDLQDVNKKKNFLMFFLLITF